MPKAAAKPDPVAVRRLHVERLLRHRKKIAAATADDALVVEEETEWLRAWCEKSGAGFREEIPGLGSVEVKAGSEARLKGIKPVLVMENFFEKPEKYRQKLLDDKVVLFEEDWSKASKPSVTVRM